MTTLSHRDRELVALGAALAANCTPCIEYHVPEARKAGLSDDEIGEAIELADKIRKVPAGTVLEAAHAQLSPVAAKTGEVSAGCKAMMGQSAKSCC